jgi:hypothetical protein
LAAVPVSPIAAVNAQTIAPAVDPAALLVGTWRCESLAGSHGTWTFTRGDDGTLSMHNTFHNGQMSGGFDEVYHFDTAHDVWTWESTEAGSPGFHERATAGPSNLGVWTFYGTLRDLEYPALGSIAQPRLIQANVRMTYTFVDDSTFRREFDVLRDGAWSITNGSTCKRPKSQG